MELTEGLASLFFRGLTNRFDNVRFTPVLETRCQFSQPARIRGRVPAKLKVEETEWHSGLC